MTSATTKQFRQHFADLPEDVQERAQSTFSIWLENPRHPSLHFKKVSDAHPVWSVRVNRSYRVLSLRDGDHVEWFWIGSHDGTDPRIKQSLSFARFHAFGQSIFVRSDGSV